jgi:AraC-like DNA-binding protein
MNWLEKQEGFAGQCLVVVSRSALSSALKEPLLRHLLPTDAGHYPKAKGHACVRKKGCPETILIYCAGGHGWCEIAGCRHKIGRNQLLVINAGTPHAYGADAKSPWTIHWFHVVGSNVPYYLERLGVSDQKPVVSLGNNVQLFSLFEDVREELERGFGTNHLICAAHSLLHLMGLIMRYKEEFWHSETNICDRVNKTVEFMQGHLRESLNISKLAALANMSRSHYSMVFRRVIGYSPSSYLNYLRMQCAVQWLSTTDCSIKKISVELGFSDQCYFSRAFRKMHNHSPSKHRQLFRI